jgi:multidrug efflux pump subunit AcrA (membrane-fusion protein)
LSPLTKLFVVLCVILSLLLTAATVVYVNKEDVQKTALANTQAQLTASRAQANALEQQMQAVQQNLQNAQQQMNDQAGRAKAQVGTQQLEISRLQVELANATSKAATQQLDISRMTEALNASQASAGKLQDEVARLRTSNDTMVRQTSDLNATVSDLTNRLDVTERERRLLAEQLTQSQTESQRLGKIITGAGLNPGQQELAVNRSGLPAINGVVRDVRTIAGNQYATISVGSADQVARGMEFKVLDRTNGNFLGTLVVDQVEPNEATGRLFGPRVAEIKPGVEVRTQL